MPRSQPIDRVSGTETRRCSCAGSRPLALLQQFNLDLESNWAKFNPSVLKLLLGFHLANGENNMGKFPFGNGASSNGGITKIAKTGPYLKLQTYVGIWKR